MTTIMHIIVGIASCAIILGCLVIIVPALRDAWAVVRQPIISNDNTPQHPSVTALVLDEQPTPEEQAHTNRQLSPVE